MLTALPRRRSITCLLPFRQQKSVNGRYRGHRNRTKDGVQVTAIAVLADTLETVV